MSIYSKTIDVQKLKSAWERVRKNKPAAGVDNITYDEFDSNAAEETKNLNRELINHEYQALPVKLVTIYKGEKARTIALYSMRDKVVQQSLAFELGKIYEPFFSDNTYAYRNDKSALIAVDEISRRITDEGFDIFVKVDITNFFDSIKWDILKSKLEKTIKEEDVISLIKQCSCSISLDETTGELIEKRCGIYQGSSIAPILSNIYMLDFDMSFTQDDDVFFVRYSDDMIVLLKDRDRAVNMLQKIKNSFDALGLTLNERKSAIGNIKDGFDFLGYHFDNTGKSVPKKAEENLFDRLEMMWLTSGDVGIEDKLKKTLEIVGGWEQYFRGEREIGSIFELAALLYSLHGMEDNMNEAFERRKPQRNAYKDIAMYFADIWRKAKFWEAELYEYEDFYEVPISTVAANDRAMPVKFLNELLDSYRQFIIHEEYDTAIEIMQSYTDLGLYNQAEFWQQKGEKIKATQDRAFEVTLNFSESANDIIYKNDSASKVMKLLVGREDLFAKEEPDGNNSRKVSTDIRPLTEQIIKEHLSGKLTVDTYVQRPNSTVHYLVTDVDISKHIILQHDRNSMEFKTYMQRALDIAQMVCRELKHVGLNAYIEYSGNRGYHVWLFFNEWIPTRYANMLGEYIDRKIEDSNDITLEFFPNKTRIKSGKYGQALKLPYGIHGKTGERSYFLDEAGNPILEVNRALDSFSKASLYDVKRVLAANSESRESTSKTEVDNDISAFGELETSITEVLQKCNLLRYLCLKSVKTSYLNHFERLTVLYVFGHLGTEGKEFVHKVMSFTLNYKYNVTENFIRKMPEKPISCIKLRDQYKQITAEYGCSCTFKRNKNCYPSPVLHAISLSDDLQGDITLPTSRTLTKEKKTEVMAEINIYSKAQEIASKILELKKQRRSVDRTISKYEKELGDIFDQQKIESLEIEMGVMRRRRTDSGIEWFIEI